MLFVGFDIASVQQVTYRRLSLSGNGETTDPFPKSETRSLHDASGSNAHGEPARAPPEGLAGWPGQAHARGPERRIAQIFISAEKSLDRSGRKGRRRVLWMAVRCYCNCREFFRI